MHIIIYFYVSRLLTSTRKPTFFQLFRFPVQKPSKRPRPDTVLLYHAISRYITLYQAISGPWKFSTWQKKNPLKESTHPQRVKSWPTFPHQICFRMISVYQRSYFVGWCYNVNICELEIQASISQASISQSPYWIWNNARWEWLESLNIRIFESIWQCTNFFFRP